MPRPRQVGHRVPGSLVRGHPGLPWSRPTTATRQQSAAHRGAGLRRLVPRTPAIPLTLVTATLIALVAVPLAAEWYTRPLFEELRTVTTPAQQLLTRVHVALALEGATLRDFAETRNPGLAVRYRTVVNSKTEAQRRLAVLAASLGPLVQERFTDLEEAEAAWHVAADELLDGPTDSRQRESRREQLYENVLIAAARLDEALDDAVQVRRSRIREAGRLQRGVSIGLSGLALLALAAVGWLARRLRSAAAEAEAGRGLVEQLMESKARLMRGVSHDLKNPVNAIEGYATLLSEGVGGDLAPMQQQHVERIRRAARSVLGLVEDLLELSRADVGRLHIACRPIDVRVVVLETVDQNRPQAMSRSHTLEARISDKVPTIDSDAARVRQALGNLLSNAIKYTPRGGRIGVDLEAVVVDPPNRQSRLVAIHVTDTGPGIPAAQLEAIFEEFTRLDTSRQQGSGLGLAIARRVARLLGGDITVQSELGVGSRFTLWLPIECRPGSSGPTEAKPGSPGRQHADN